MNQYSGNTRYYGCGISSDPEEVWSLDIEIPLSYIMADYDRIFYLDRTQSNYKLKCRDVNTGDLYWETSVPWLGFYELLLQDEKLYIFKNDEENTLICYDAHDGSMLWTSEDIYDIYPDVGELYARSMNCSDGKILLYLSSYHNEVNNNVFCCFNANNGNIIWHTNKNEYDNSSNHPSIDGGVMYYSAAKFEDWTSYSKIIGLDIDTGNVAYQYTPPERYDQLNGRNIVVSDGLIYAMTFDKSYETARCCMICISKASNNIVWSSDIGDNWGVHFIVGADQVVVIMQEEIICLDKGTGNKVWSIPMDYHTVNIPIATSDYLLVFRAQYQAEIQPQLLLIDNESGEEVWRFTLDGNYIQNGASFYGEKILIGTDVGKLYCFE